jgi:hypothetical protein
MNRRFNFFDSAYGRQYTESVPCRQRSVFVAQRRFR